MCIRDRGYTVAVPPPPVPLVVIETVTGKSYAHTSNSFTNNPASPIQWPFTTGVPISDGFGPRLAPCSACSSFHKGLDMNPGEGAPIQAMADGVVSTVVSKDDGGLGVYVVIDHVIDGQNVQSWYGHMLTGSVAVTKGQKITVGQLVGNVGNTGTSTGAHLHFEVHVNGTAIDPYAWLKSHVTA
ncbi:M23 family metallopeptidase, partial [Subtercola sp. RTI3]|uniref:M23 family metallopeptidase n=1 Tax=Subtercola sp. RTI3 TaxID=3048639 RepID=UPI002B221D60